MTNTMGPFYAYKETRLDLDPATQGSTIAIRLPAYGSTTWSSKTAQKRAHIAETHISDDENSFKQKNLASAGSIYHRLHHGSPRSFLWRVLEDGKVLSIRAVDITKQRDALDANLTLKLSFPNPMKPSCIAFSDSKDHDVLTAFVLTESKHLYTISLRPDYFRRPSSTEDNVGDWCKSYLSSAFAFKTAHRLVALSADELLLSFYDGGLVRMSKPSGGDGAQWTERYYNEGGWSLKGIFQGSTTVRFGKANIELSAATSIASPVTSIDGMPYAFTVCLDHRLRVWNLQSGKIAFMADVLDQELEPQEHAKQVIQPSYSQLVKVYENNDENALCVTYSPLGTGQFKFWAATPLPDGNLDVVDMFPNNHLEPQAPTAELWTLADFSVLVDRSSAQGFKLWTLWKNNISYRVQMLEFQNGSISKVRDVWRNGWKAMAAESPLDTNLPTMLASDPLDATDQWLKFILAPGKFSVATVETGLAIYERGLGTSKNTVRKTTNLPERMCASIASTASLSRGANGSMDYDQFRSATDIQWRRFFRLLQELNGQRGEALSMVLDPYGEMPQVILADGIAALRDCSNLELVWHNSNRVAAGKQIVPQAIFSASGFRDSVSDQFIYNCRTAVLGEIFGEPSLTAVARMRSFYDKCDFSNQIGDEEFNQLVTNLGGGFGNMTPHMYEEILGLLDRSERPTKNKTLRPLAEYGNKLIVRGVQEVVELHKGICLDQLIVLVLIEAEINHGEEGIGFESAPFFMRLLEVLKRLELVSWLANTQIALPLEKTERSNSITEKSASFTKKPAPSTETITVLEAVLRHLFGIDLQKHTTLTSAVTEVIGQICVPDSGYETSPSVIQCYLLKNHRVDLAREFDRFSGSEPFPMYVKGRVCLAADDPDAAALHFKKAAFGMSQSDPKNQPHSAGYLDETEKNLLNSGLARYYSHIVALYDKEKIASYVIEFARLSLKFIVPGNKDTQTSHLGSEMHSRLFNAAIQTSRFDLAHSVVHLFTNSALQRSSLRTLVTKMCESSYASQLTSLPFIGLQEDVDEILAQKCQSIVDVNTGIPYHKILYAWRIRHNDFRGAASISFERLQRLLALGDNDKALGEEGLETAVTKQYVALINALCCVDPQNAWILAEEIPKKHSAKGAAVKRKVVTLADVRRAYQSELDRITAIENNQFAFVGDDEMDIL